MVKIRLSRHGKRNDPSYRIVAIEARDKREGRELEILGFWNPREDKKKIDKKAFDKWISNGAQPSASVKKLIA